jgi:hypothetical protein
MIGALAIEGPVGPVRGAAGFGAGVGAGVGVGAGFGADGFGFAAGVGAGFGFATGVGAGFGFAAGLGFAFGAGCCDAWPCLTATPVAWLKTAREVLPARAWTMATRTWPRSAAPTVCV